MTTESISHEWDQILADLHSNSKRKLAAINKLSQLETIDPRIVQGLEQVILNDPFPDIQKAALEVLRLPQAQRAHRRLSELTDEARASLPSEIDRWTKDQLISTKTAWLLKRRVGYGPIAEPVRPTAPTPVQATAAVPAVPNPAPVQAVSAPAPKPAPPPALKAPRKEAVPFDQWLLSERNIKIALYAGGALLVLAGIIFIGVNWMHIPGPIKFGITLLITGLTYLGGYLLFQKPLLRIGGVALLGVASGFLPLNFVVLQIYVLGPRGLADEVMWLIASPMCLLLYVLTAYWTKSRLFTFISQAGYLSTIAAALVVIDPPLLVYGLVFALAFLGLLLLARFFQSLSLSNFTRLPLLIVAHVGMPLAILANLVGWVSETGCYRKQWGCSGGNPWLALVGLFIGAVFYLTADRLFQSRFSRWVASFLLCGTLFMVLEEFNAMDAVFHYALLLIPLIYFAIGYAVERTEKKRAGALPLYSVAGLVAMFSTLAATSNYFDYWRWGGDEILPASLGRALFVDVLLMLGVEFLLHIKDARWLSVFVLPVAIYFTLEAWHFAPLAMVISLMVLALVYLSGGYMLKLREKPISGDLPFYIAAYAIAGFATLIAFQSTFALMIALYLDVVLLVATNILLKRIEARWVAAFLFLAPFLLSLDLLHFSQTATGLSVMILSLAYLVGGYLLERREKRTAHAWPLYAAAYAFALLVTWQAMPKTKTLIEVLFGDVILLIVSAAIHRVYWWVYGAAWLFMLPVYMTISLLVPQLPNQGLLMGILGLNYTAAGYALGRRVLRLGAPFLSCAAFLSVVAVALSWFNYPTACVVLVIVAALYLLAALWLNWPWMLIVTWLAANLLCLALNLIFFRGVSVVHAATITYAVFGAALLAGAVFVQRKVELRWSLPLFVAGTINLAGAYLAGLALGGWMAVGLSALMAIYLLTFAWLEREWLKSPVLTYIGLGVVTIGYFFTIGELGGLKALEVWPIYAAILCALFVLLAWLLRREPFTAIFSQPLSQVGLWAMLAPMAGTAFLTRTPVLIAVTFAIATLTYLGDAALRKVLSMAYIGLGALVATIWAVLVTVKIHEPQAYVYPLALVLLGVGWKERTREHLLTYRLTSLLGLGLLMGTAFYQSLDTGGIFYAILLLVESILALGYGIWQHKRGFVQVGGIALLVNAVTQLGPGFVDLDRWIQIAVIGSLLFGMGLAALFKRQDILEARQKFSESWRLWEP